MSPAAPPATAGILVAVIAVVVLMPLLGWADAAKYQFGCDELPHYTDSVECPATQRYRPIDGSCNNLKQPSLGSAHTPFLRIVPPEYGNDAGAPRQSKSGKPLPSAHVIVREMFPEKNVTHFTSHLFVIWGQLLSHDFARIAAPRNQARGACCALSAGDECIPIPVPKNDPFYAKFLVHCLPLSRANSSTCRSQHPEQLSDTTHYIDLSFVYGSDEETMMRVRSGKGGELRVVVVDGQVFPPDRDDAEAFCGHRPCYAAGDDRINQNPLLAALQVILLREHNRVCRELAGLNAHWDDETLFQEARRIVVAEWQLITYRDWLQWMIGVKRVRELKLIPDVTCDRSEYRADWDPRTANDVATAGYRAFHSLVQGQMWLGRPGDGRATPKKEQQGFFDKIKDSLASVFNPGSGNSGGGGGSSQRSIALGQWFENPGPILKPPTGMCDVIEGMVYQDSQDQDEWIDSEITQQMRPVQTPIGPWGNNLAAIDIQRGRDCGLPSCNAYREYLGKKRAQDFGDLADTLDEKHIAKLRELYEHVDDVDYYVCGILEEHDKAQSQLAGPLFSTFLEDQYARWRYGDRFFYNFVGFEHSFTEAQLKALQGTSATRLFCDNLDCFKGGPQDPFIKVGHDGNEEKSCEELSRVDFSAWREEKKSS